MPHLEDLSSPAADSGALAPDAERLAVALQALTGRDRVLAERTRRLTSLEDAAARLVAATARLAAAQDELSALRRTRKAELAERDQRIADLEQRLVATTSPGPKETSDPGGAAVQGQSVPLASARAARDPEGEGRAGLAAPPSEQAARWSANGQTDDYARLECLSREPLPAKDAADLARAQEGGRQQREVLEEQQALIATLLERLRQSQGIQEGPDDLKRIAGVGPVIEALLHSIGITTFEQMAAFSHDDVSRVGELLGAFRERIQRDRWIEQAAELAGQRTRPGDQAAPGPDPGS